MEQSLPFLVRSVSGQWFCFLASPLLSSVQVGVRAVTGVTLGSFKQ